MRDLAKKDCAALWINKNNCGMRALLLGLIEKQKLFRGKLLLMTGYLT